MKTAGQILKEKRLEKKLTPYDIEKATKIRQKFIIALENDNLDSLPGKIYVRGFVKNYAEFLGFPTEDLLAILRRQYDEAQKKELLPRGLTQPKLTSKLFSHKFTVPIAFLMAVILLSFYLYFQYQLLEGAPNLVLESPKENLTVKSDSIIVKGKTDQEAKLFINGQEIIVNTDGTFSQEVRIKEGENNIIITSVNKQGKEKKIERTIKKKSP